MALSREAATKVFWQSFAPAILADRGSIARILYADDLPPVSLAPPAAYDFDEITPHNEVFFYLEGQSFGRNLYVAVMHEGDIIVPPFPIEQRENLPSMRPANL